MPMSLYPACSAPEHLAGAGLVVERPARREAALQAVRTGMRVAHDVEQVLRSRPATSSSPRFSRASALTIALGAAPSYGSAT